LDRTKLQALSGVHLKLLDIELGEIKDKMAFSLLLIPTICIE
jgi:hypothetical protein